MIGVTPKITYLNISLTKMIIILSILSYQVGSGIFDPSLGDPEHCHATNTTSWELSLAARHYHPSSQTMARHILALCPSQEISSSDFSITLDVSQ